MGKILDQATLILTIYAEKLDWPASISGKHHVGETNSVHLQRCISIMGHLCDEFNIPDDDREMLIAACMLHDIGGYDCTEEGEISQPGWKYYPETNLSRKSDDYFRHPGASAELLELHTLDRKKEIQDIVRTHMSHWYWDEPQPETFYQRLLCIADYISTRKEDELFNYKPRVIERKNEKK